MDTMSTLKKFLIDTATLSPSDFADIYEVIPEEFVSVTLLKWIADRANQKIDEKVNEINFN